MTGNDANHNVAVYQQYVEQSRLNGAAMPQPYPLLPVAKPASITVHRSTGHAAAGLSSGQEARRLSNAAPDAGGGQGAGVSPQDIQLDTPPTGCEPGNPLDEDQPSDSWSSSGDTVTAAHGWGPDPALAQHWIAEGAPNASPSPSSPPPMNEHGGGGFAGLGRTAGLPGARGRDGQEDRKPGPSSGVGSGDNVLHRSVPQAATPVTTGGGASGLGGPMWGAPIHRGKGEDDGEHTPRYGRFVEPDVLFGSDAPAWPSVIGAEIDDEDDGGDQQ